MKTQNNYLFRSGIIYPNDSGFMAQFDQSKMNLISQILNK